MIRNYKKTVTINVDAVWFDGSNVSELENYINSHGLTFHSSSERPQDDEIAKKEGWQEGETLWIKVYGESCIPKGYLSSIILKPNSWLVIYDRSPTIYSDSSFEEHMKCEGFELV